MSKISKISTNLSQISELVGNNYKDLMRMICDTPTSKCYLIDIPRSIEKDKLYGMFSAIEEIKGGYAWIVTGKHIILIRSL